MKTTVTQECHCGYVYEEETKIDKKDIREDKSVCFRTGVVGLKDNKPVEETIVRRVKRGDEPFEPLIINSARKDYSMIVCPKCGSVLLSSRVTKIEEEE